MKVITVSEEQSFLPFLLTLLQTIFGFPRKAKKFNGKVRREALHFTALS